MTQEERYMFDQLQKAVSDYESGKSKPIVKTMAELEG